MFDKLRAMLGYVDQTPVTTPTPAAPVTPTTAVTTSGSSAAAAPAIVQPVRADLIEVKVNGMAAAKANAVWLTKGLDRTQPATAVLLVDCTSDHLQNILANKPNLSDDYRRVITSILEDRGIVVDLDTDDDNDAPDADDTSDLTGKY